MNKRRTRTIWRQLASVYRRHGCVRRQNQWRKEHEGWVSYKKGDEVRLAARSYEELRRIRRLLQEAGFRPGSPFVTGRQYRQPIYGREDVARFLELVEEYAAE